MLKIKSQTASALDNGVVIDHIPAGIALKLIEILKLNKNETSLVLVLNSQSTRLGVKDIIKIQDYTISSEELSMIAIFAPEATVSIISNYTIISKIKVSFPSEIRALLTCPNKVCISNHERMASVFITHFENSQLHLQCKYCEKSFVKTRLGDYIKL